MMADIVAWMASIYDPETDLRCEINSEDGRILFVKSAVAMLFSKAQLKLNPKKLYSADGLAIQEMLKIAIFLNQVHSLKSDDDLGEFTSISYDASRNSSNLKACKQLSTQLIKKCPDVYDLLEKEVELRDNRNDQISQQLDMQKIEKFIKDQVSDLNQQSNLMDQTIQNLSADESNLNAKLEKKKQELERKEKRMKSLQGVRPVFMDEFEKYEADLQKLHLTYVERFRNMSYLEHQLRILTDKEREVMHERQMEMKKWISQLKQEEMSMLRDDYGITGDESKKFLDIVTADLSLSSTQANNLKLEPRDSLKSPGKQFGSVNIADEDISQKFQSGGDDDEDLSSIYDF